MNPKVKLLSLTVWITVSLLTIGATLVVLGIFNAALQWDIFSSQVEAVLYGIFFSCVALSAFGVAMTFVLGIKKIVEAVESLEQNRRLDSSLVVPEARRITYAGYMLGIVTAMSALIGVLALVDYQVQIHRSQVFKRVASEQMETFRNKFLQQVTLLKKPPANNIPKTLPELVESIGGLSFVRNITLYVPDSQDESAMWRYTRYQRNSKGEPIFERFFVAKDYEKAIKQALKNNSKSLNSLNQKTGFQWYYVLKDARGNSIAVIRVDGNPQENFREYTF
ncbi:hypothetical protein [Argonema antarcticum]|uniref:hypothetical protein n=1 Tax=Argonema antarcticum TaxID=2942763 RepID=UPI002013AAC2|nr:hypothetical protein [Argonema antarcticum]MCL1469919.1 hypothetical protein [Argonema antarcticum A004/B2]